MSDPVSDLLFVAVAVGLLSLVSLPLILVADLLSECDRCGRSRWGR